MHAPQPRYIPLSPCCIPLTPSCSPRPVTCHFASTLGVQWVMKWYVASTSSSEYLTKWTPQHSTSTWLLKEHATDALNNFLLLRWHPALVASLVLWPPHLWPLLDTWANIRRAWNHLLAWHPHGMPSVETAELFVILLYGMAQWMSGWSAPAWHVGAHTQRFMKQI